MTFAVVVMIVVLILLVNSDDPADVSLWMKRALCLLVSDDCCVKDDPYVDTQKGALKGLIYAFEASCEVG